MSADIWDRGYSVHLSSFYGWSPESWGTISYRDRGRRDTVLKETTDPFIAVIYVIKSHHTAIPEERGMILGFYLVSHEVGHRNDFTAKHYHSESPDRWQYGFRATRAFSFLPEYRISIDEFDPSIVPKARAVARYGMTVDPSALIKLATIPFVEEQIYGGHSDIDPVVNYSSARATIATSGKGKVGSGAVNRSGYSVPAEPVDAPKELYVLRLDGDIEGWLGEPAKGRSIFKIGYSMSPLTRRNAFQRSLPQGRYTWHLDRSTFKEGDDRYPGSETAIAGEEAMKNFLAKNADWLGGEFYAATNTQIAKAWKIGRKAAQKRLKACA